jgi:hypothetical protein
VNGAGHGVGRIILSYVEGFGFRLGLILGGIRSAWIWCQGFRRFGGEFRIVGNFWSADSGYRNWGRIMGEFRNQV